MNRTLVVFVLMFLILTTSTKVFSQIENAFYLGAAFPTGKFGKTPSNATAPLYKYNIAKGATVGLDLGYRFSYKFDIGEDAGAVLPFFEANFMWNSLKSSLKEIYEDSSFSKPNYYNIPLLLGVQYRYEFSKLLTFFGEFGLGFDLFSISSEKGYTKVKYKTTGAFAWEIGCGTFIGKNVSLGLHYYNFGKHKIMYRGEDVVLGTRTETRNIGEFVVRLGLHF